MRVLRLWRAGSPFRRAGEGPRRRSAPRGAVATEIALASTSPRRSDILRQLGLDFEEHNPGIDEASVGGAAPADLVVARALAKALAVAPRRPAALVVGADTVVAVAGRVLGKPSGPAEASAMLHLLQGRAHSVWTGLALVRGDIQRTAADEARVWMRPLDGSAIEAYVRTGEPLDKAGAYAIQGRGAALVRRLEGDFFTVVGLSVAALVVLLEEFGVRLPG